MNRKTSFALLCLFFPKGWNMCIMKRVKKEENREREIKMREFKLVFGELN